MRRYVPGEIVAAVESLKDSEPNAMRILGTMIAGSIISGEISLAGGNLLLDIMGRRRVEPAEAREDRLGSHCCPEWDGMLIHPGTPEWEVCICERK